MLDNLIVGASGFIGKKLLSTLRETRRVSYTSRHGAGDSTALDLQAPEDFNYSLLNPGDTIYLLAAISSPDICRNQPELARAVNVSGTSVFIRRAIDRGAKVIFFSSDTVYGNRSSGFDETAECNPVGDYAKMKCEVEDGFKADNNFKSVRLSYVFSYEDKFTTYLKNCATSGEIADIFDPFDRAVIHRDDVIQGVINISKKWDYIKSNVINFAGPDVLSRVQYAEILKNNALTKLSFHIKIPPSAFFENRPRRIAMTSLYFEKIIGRQRRNLAKAVQLEFGLSRIKK